jgi:hypothetical protein
MAHEVYHVVPRPGGQWAVEKPKADRASGLFETQNEAREQAHEWSNGGVVYVHGLNGKIRKEQRDD